MQPREFGTGVVRRETPIIYIHMGSCADSAQERWWGCRDRDDARLRRLDISKIDDAEGESYRKSIGGCVVFVDDVPASWMSKIQSIVALSSTLWFEGEEADVDCEEGCDQPTF